MNREEAKLILQVYRLGGRDAEDSQFAEALALAKRDSELAAWFAGQQKFDAMVSGGLQQVRAPFDLKAKILATEQEEKIIEPPISLWWQNLISWRSPVSWAMAAAVLLLLGLAVFWNRPASSSDFADYRVQMVHAAEDDAHHVDVLNSNMKQVLAWLGEHQGENNLVLPPTLSGTTGLMGCRVLDWHGQKVSMLCYNLKDSEHVDLFVASADFFSDMPPVDQPQYVSSGGMQTASWSHDGKVYLMVSHADTTNLEKILSPKTAVKTRSFACASNYHKIFLE